jgi:hypothetical protein
LIAQELAGALIDKVWGSIDFIDGPVGSACLPRSVLEATTGTIDVAKTHASPLVLQPELRAFNRLRANGFDLDDVQTLGKYAETVRRRILDHYAQADPALAQSKRRWNRPLTTCSRL